MQRLAEIGSQTVHCVVTSPPYYRLRDYGVAGQIGLEDSPAAFIEKLVDTFREVRRVMHPSGTLWVNIGDTYAGSGVRKSFHANPGAYNHVARGGGIGNAATKHGFRRKNLMGMPWRLAFALQDDGWELRSDIIWAKTNPKSESVRDRPTLAHEYIFLFTKELRYGYDNLAVREPLNSESLARYRRGSKYDDEGYESPYPSIVAGPRGKAGYGANLRSVWHMSVGRYQGAHYATFPEELPRRAILLGSSAKGVCDYCLEPWRWVEEPAATEDAAHDADPNTKFEKGSASHRLSAMRDAARAQGHEYQRPARPGNWEAGCSCDGYGIHPARVLDPFVGSGTTGLVALREGRLFIGIDLDPKSIELSRKRIMENLPLLAQEE